MYINFNLAEKINKIETTKIYKRSKKLAFYISDENNAYEVYKFFKENNLSSDVSPRFLHLFSRIVDKKLNIDLDTDLYFMSLSFIERFNLSKYYANKFRKLIEPYKIIEGSKFSGKANLYNFDNLNGKVFLINTVKGMILITEIFSKNLTEKEFKELWKDLIKKIKVNPKDAEILGKLPKSVKDLPKMKTNKLKYIKIDKRNVEKIFIKINYYKNLLKKDLKPYEKRNIEKALKKLERDVKIANLNEVLKTGRIYYNDNISEKNGRNYHLIATLSKETRSILFSNYVSIDLNNCAPTIIWQKVNVEIPNAKEKFPLYKQYALYRNSFFDKFEKPDYITKEQMDIILKLACVGINFGSDLIRDIKAARTLFEKRYSLKNSRFYEKFKDLGNIEDILFFFLREKNFLLIKKFQEELSKIRKELNLSKEELANYFMSIESKQMNKIINYLEKRNINSIRIHDELLIEKRNFYFLEKEFFNLFTIKEKTKNHIIEFTFKFKIKDLRSNKIIKLIRKCSSNIIEKNKEFLKKILKIIKNKLEHTKQTLTLVLDQIVEFFKIDSKKVIFDGYYKPAFGFS